VHWLSGGESKPTFTPPRPFERGVGGRPTLVNNVETLAHLALVARFGAAWYRAIGTADDPGSTLVTVTGDVSRPGVYEVALGSAVESALAAAIPTGSPQAVLVGGYSGTWLPAGALGGIGVDSASLRRVGAVLGCGTLSVLGPGACGLQETAAVARWMAGQSAGQCGPCAHGLPAMADAFDALVRGERRPAAQRRLAQLFETVAGRGACHHPDGVIRMARSALAVFAGEIERHRRHGPCRQAHTVLPVPAVAGGWR